MVNNTLVRKNIVVLIVFILLGLGIYFNSLNNGFHYDDNHHIVQNTYIQNLGNIPLFFTEHRTFSVLSGIFLHYRPLVLISYAFNFYFGGLDSIGYHLVNLGFHIGSAFVLFLIIMNIMREMEGKFFAGLAAGLLFLTTPFNSEVVNYVTARSSVMSTFFCLLAFYCWVRYRGEETDVRGKTSCFYLASLLAFLLGILTKEVAITLPALLLLYDIYFKKVLIKSNYLTFRPYVPYIPFVSLGIFVGFIIRLVFFKAFSLSSALSGGVQEYGTGVTNNFNKLMIAVKVLAKYSYSIIVPLNLSIWHRIENSLNVYFVLSFILVIGLLILAYLLWRNSDQLGKAVSFFIVFFFLTLLPMTLVSLHAPYQENRGHIAAAGLIGAIAIGLVKLRARLGKTGLIKSITYAVLVIMVVIYSAGTVMRNMVWKDDLTLWSNVIKNYPESVYAKKTIARAYLRSGDFDASESASREILKNDPGNVSALSNLGIIHLKRGELDIALGYFLKAKERNPYDPEINVNLARIYKEKGDMPSTAKQLLSLIAVSPHNLPAYQELVEVYSRMGEMEKVYRMMLSAIEEDPDNPGAHRALGLIYMHSGRLQEAQNSFERVHSAAPNNQDVILDLGYVYAKQGMFDRAEGMFKKVISLSPDDPEASEALANVYQRQGRLDDALSLYQGILSKNPEQFRSYNNLGLLYFSKRDMASAVNVFSKAISLNPDDYIARFNLARVYESQGQKDLARKELKGVLMRTSGDNQTRKIYEVAQQKLSDMK